ncbi:MAG: hypothetical protein JO041_06190 [Acidobacteria bacterium]|nr:hypothetical protein [Acidobacteriota bacterium]
MSYAAAERAPVGRPQAASWRIIAAGLLAVCAVYAIPLVLPFARNGRIQPVKMPDEAIYMVRVAAAARGQSLASPYLAGHEDAPQYMPALSERALSLVVRLGISPGALASAMRVLQPALIFLLVVAISMQLGSTAFSASAAGLLATLLPSFSQAPWNSAGLPGYLRYLRFLSPGFHVIVFLAAVWLVAACWNRRTWASGVAAGVAIGVVFYLPIFYWAALWCAAALMAVTADGGWKARRALLLGCAIGAGFSVPVAMQSLRNAGNVAVQQTLHRWPTLMLLPGRRPEDAQIPLALAACVIIALGIYRRSRVLRFLAPFFLVSIPLILQNVITNRRIQAYHFIDPLLPLAAIAVAELGAQRRTPRTVIAGFAVLLATAGAVRMVVDENRLEQLIQKQPESWDLEACMPRTVAMLRQKTPPGSVVDAPLAVMEILPIFTANHVYYAEFARQHVVGDEEITIRGREAAKWPDVSILSYPADYYLGTGEACDRLPGIFFRDAQEHACIGSARAAP